MRLVATLSAEDIQTMQHATAAARLRAERVIRDNPASARLDSDRIAALADISKSTLYRLFEDVGGVTSHVRRVRLDATHDALMDPSQASAPINMIAANAGFHCAASFNRSFTARFGASPCKGRAADDPAIGEPAAGNGGGLKGSFLGSVFGRQARKSTPASTAPRARST